MRDDRSISNSNSSDLQCKEIAMDFWSIIGESELSDGDSADLALEGIRRRLYDLSPIELVQFSDRVAEYCYRLDRRDFATIPFTLANGITIEQSEDAFVGFRCAVILSGWRKYRDVLEGRLDFASFVKPGLSGDALTFVAAEVYEEKTGKPFTHRSEFPYETGSNEAGWGDAHQ